MEAPFDISADLDTPVSTYLKLGPLKPRYLLESVEGGAYLARYSFLGFGDISQVRVDDRALVVDGEERPLPESTAELLGTLREVLAATPELSPVVPDLPFRGGLVGIAGYDLVRYFERLDNPERDAQVVDCVEGAFHEVHNEPAALREEAFEAVLAWFEGRLAKLS